MIKRIAIGIAAGICSITGLGVVTAPAASADQRPCVSWQEYQDIKWQYPPATQGRVNDHFDMPGYLLEGWGTRSHHDVVRAYPKCREWGPGYAVVWFDNYSWDWRSRVWAVAPSIRAYNSGNVFVVQ